MNGSYWKLCACLLIVVVAGCGSTYRQDITTSDNVNVVQPPAESHVRLVANVYLDQSRSAVWLSGDARNTTGNPLLAGHVHATLWGAQHNILADRQFVLFQSGGTPRVHRGSKKTFGGEIAAALPSDFRLEIAYHTQSH